MQDIHSEDVIEWVAKLFFIFIPSRFPEPTQLLQTLNIEALIQTWLNSLWYYDIDHNDIF